MVTRRTKICICGGVFFSVGKCCRFFLSALLLILPALSCSTLFAATPPMMRPYAGIGVVVFSPPAGGVPQDLQLQMYDEPGLLRVALLKSTVLTGNEWIFGPSNGTQPLIVSARKGNWLRVFFDDAGREAWIDPQNKGHFQSWEQFLKVRTVHMLLGLQPQYYQMQNKQGGKQLSTLTPKQVLKVLKLENSWVLVLTDQGQIGWVRWCDDDGRLTVGTGKK